MERSRGAPCPLCPPKLRPVRHQDTATATSRRWSPSGGHRAVPSLWLGKGSPSPRRQEAAPGCHLRRLLTAGRRRRGGHSHEYISAGKMGSFLSWAVSTSILSGPLGHSTATRSGETKTSLAGLKRHLFPSRPRGRSQPSNASVQGTHASQSPRVRLSECVLPPQYPPTVSSHRVSTGWRPERGLREPTAERKGRGLTSPLLWAPNSLPLKWKKR